MASAYMTSTSATPRWRRKLAIVLRRRGVFAAIELGSAALAIAIGIASYGIITAPGGTAAGKLMSPPLLALMLAANLVAGTVLLVLLGRRIAARRAAASPVGGRGRLHVRLVGLFSLIASVPMLLVVLFASLLFQYGVEFWFSDRARGMLENASILAQQVYTENREDVVRETSAMAGDLGAYLVEAPIDSPIFMQGFGGQVFQRELSEAAILKVDPKAGVQSLVLVNPYERSLETRLTPAIVKQLRTGANNVVTDTGDRIEAVVKLPVPGEYFLYAARVSNPRMIAQSERASAVLADYRSLLARSRALQLQFNLALLVVALLIVGLAVWVALAVADRLVRPVGDLVDAAQRVAEGDLSARVPAEDRQDEMGRVANAFNRMTRRLEEQTLALVTANDQLDRRRALIEAVLAGVSAGVISVDAARCIRLINTSALSILGAPDDQSAIGKPLDQFAPALAEVIARGDAKAIVEFAGSSESRTLAVTVEPDGSGQVLTFDDITQQLSDQRRAAWTDVARRIAHEIKNPLTPIQLAAERLQRRYGRDITDDDGVFEQLTATIVRQVGDLRRMVDEFSSFARMPKPIFRAEPIADIVRQIVFLHQVAHADIAFDVIGAEANPVLVCDRRQIGQAVTNIVKNAIEAIGQRQADAPREGRPIGHITVTLREDAATGTLTLSVADDGAGLPKDRDKLLEPYVTTRRQGTGLGLAIVGKIAEEHLGALRLSDNPTGGTIVSLCFPVSALAALVSSESEFCEAAPEALPAIPHNRQDSL